MWTVVYLAKNKKEAEKMSGLITQEGVLVKIQPVSKSANEEEGYYEVLVPEVEVEEAHSILIELGY
ncbi:MAG: hypothetical protein K0R80_2219 [Clostridia bacterium]|jgi:hypothetical protein|nr:hypothetical protein [Clostridia bacterium]MDF2891852.1 hypothetical protein [Clostridia bacterium]